MKFLNDSLQFIEINKKSDKHIKFLYKNLIERKFNISNNAIPSMEEHISFVQNNPYFKWFIVEKLNHFIGSFYIMDNNSIGINLEANQNIHIKDIINFIKRNYKPFPPIKSVRSGNFFINVAAQDHEKIDALQTIKSKLIQSTYLII